jgi:uncharacterized protein YcbK (DUF882 family)
MHRRDVLAAAAMLPSILPTGVLAQQAKPDPLFWSLPRRLRLYRPATGERVDEVYFADGQIVWAGYKRICWLLRDVRENKAVQMSPVLLDVLAGTQGFLRAAGHTPDFYATSGHRTDNTNAMTEGAARLSKHREGRAVDGFAPGVPIDLVARIGVYLAGGGWASIKSATSSTWMTDD